MKLKGKKGFTLVEMIIVIIIIGILVVSLIPKILGLQQRSRDTKRIQDVRQISYAVYTYYFDNNVYPDKGNNGDGGWATSAKFGFIPSLVPKYLKDMPKDPINQDMPGEFYFLKNSNKPDYYYVYYAYPANSAWTNSGCNFIGDQFAVVGAVTLEIMKDKASIIDTSCEGGRSWNDEIDYPYAIQSRGEFY